MISETFTAFFNLSTITILDTHVGANGVQVAFVSSKTGFIAKLQDGPRNKLLHKVRPLKREPMHAL